jgi:predicted nucleotidyltransferase
MQGPEVEIGRRLRRVEQDHAVRVLFACESGSRAWGFPSRNSDYDVRFIYIRPEDWYLSIDLERRRDVIELPIEDEFDINGWDVRKALKLFVKSNPPLLEWLNSPVVYLEHGTLASSLRELDTGFRCRSGSAGRTRVCPSPRTPRRLTAGRIPLVRLAAYDPTIAGRANMGGV